MTKIISVQHLKLGLQQHHRLLIAVDDLSFVLHKGQTVALLGESGCGKSLTSLALMRLLSKEFHYGVQSQIQFGNACLLDLPEKKMREIRGAHMAMIFQEPMTALNPVLSIGTQLAEVFLKDKQFPRANLNKAMVELLTEVEISEPEHRLSQYPYQLSGGQRQRIVIAMALALKPDVLIADEPTTALDVTTQAQILNLLKRLQARYQMSIILITHDMAVVKRMADTVCVMYAGQLVESADVKSFMQAPAHPYAQQLFVSLPSFAKRAERLQVIQGCVPALDEMPKGCRFHTRCAHAFARCQQEEPKLLTLPDGRHVRCHYYPQHASLPVLPKTNETWSQPAALESQAILKVDDLAVYFYPKGISLGWKRVPFKAVDGVSFSLHKGKTLALVGESGCGKSTVCRAILRLQDITRGVISYRDVGIHSLHGPLLKAFRKKVQIIFQDPFSSMNPRMMIQDILAEGMRAQKMPPDWIQKKLHQLLDQVNLPQNCLTRYPHQFSGGQRQRICIARALATDPEVIVCDEPTSALDISVQAQILNLMKSLQYELGLSYLFITHNMGVVSYIADEVLVMRNGVIVEHGTCEQVMQTPKDPYTKMLLSSIDSEG